MTRLIAVGQNGYFVEEADGRYSLEFHGATSPIYGDLLADWVPLAHTILAEAEIIQREKDGA